MIRLVIHLGDQITKATVGMNRLVNKSETDANRRHERTIV